ncbi:major facilitator superfamily domain-containing protein [Astrocystis sublimbata]|nr:major facilitator superfamily domain-containing protein [Astrocystis sublimbata]
MDSRESIDSQRGLLSSPPDTDDTREIPTEPCPQETRVGDDDSQHRDVVRRIDRHIMPLLFLAAMVNFMDKTILSSASVFGLREDTGLIDPGDSDGKSGKNKFAWVAAAFYIGYALCSYPAAALLSRVPANKILGTALILCGVVVFATSLCSDFAGLVTCRFLLGAFEAAVTPSLVFVTGTWYTRSEIPKRTGVWFAGHAAGGIAASVLAFAIAAALLVEDGPHAAGKGAWRQMFALLGVLTLSLGVVVLVRLPGSIPTAAFLYPEERKLARDRVATKGMGSTVNAVWKWEQARECLRDPQTWLVAAISLCCQIPNGGTQNFANLVITELGFRPFESLSINVPYSILCIGVISGSGWCAGRFRSMNCFLIASVVIPPIVGSALIAHRTAISSRRVSLFAYFLLSSGPAALPLLLSLVQSNIRGITKKNTTTALLFVAYCVGNIAGPQLFVEGEAPAYATAFRGIVICYSLVVGLSLLLRVYLMSVNRHRALEDDGDRVSGLIHAVSGGNLTRSEEAREVESQVNSDEDITDWKTVGFRYRL